MAKRKKYYYIIDFYPSGEEIDSRDHDEYFESEDEAHEAAEYTISCAAVGAEVLHLSDPTEYPSAEPNYEDTTINIYEA